MTLHTWLFRISLGLAATLLGLLYSNLVFFLAHPSFHSSGPSLALTHVHLTLIVVVTALAFGNFERLQATFALLLIIAAVVNLSFSAIAILSGVFQNLRTVPSLLELSGMCAEQFSLVTALFGAVLWRKRRRIDYPTQQTSAQESLVAVPAPKLLRFAAFVIDYGVFAFLVVISTILLGTTSSTETKPSGLQFDSTFNSLLACFWIWVALFPVAEALLGRTIGKALLQLRVQRLRSADHQWKTGILRHLLDVLEVFPFGVPAFIFILLRKDARRIGDLLAGTVVVRSS